MNRSERVNAPRVPKHEEPAQAERLHEAKAMTAKAKAIATEARKAGLPDVSIEYYRAATGRNP